MKRSFYTEDYNTGWDGFYKNGKAPDDTCLYMVSAFNRQAGQNVYKSGTLLLVRD